MMSLTDWMSGAELVKHLMVGDLLEFNMVTYSHWGIYVGEQTISTPCSSSGTGDVITGDLVHLTREANAVVLEWVKDQNQEVRKNNLKDNETMRKIPRRWPGIVLDSTHGLPRRVDRHRC